MVEERAEMLLEAMFGSGSKDKGKGVTGADQMKREKSLVIG